MSRNRRQELYDRIRESSMDEVTLEEMIRHGFWPSGEPLPSVAADVIARRGELQREIAEISKDAHLYRNQERALKQVMKDRMREAKERRIETKRRHIAERNARAKAWHERKTNDIVHLGDGHTAALQNRGSDQDRLGAMGLPVFADLPDIARAMGVDLGELRFLAYDRSASKVSHYKRFRIAKKSGGYRNLSAPMPRLKRAQYWVLDNILEQIEPHDAAHGFRTGRSILTNAAPHAKKAVVVNYDLKDFFPSIGYRRVKGLFASFGYAEAQAALFALLTTEADREEVQMDGQTWHVASGERAVPQGAPTSPAITNLLCRKLDRRLQGTARKLGFAYTRYADDLTFSRAQDDPKALRQLDWSIRQIVADEGFTLNDAKTRTMRRSTRQEVTGITVNDGLTVSRKERRKFRAYLHNTAKGQETGSFRNGAPKNSALGYAQFLTMVHGEAVAGLTAQAHRLFGSGHQGPPARTREAFRDSAARGEAPTKNWWQPARVPEPIPEPDPVVPMAPKTEASTPIPEMPTSIPAAGVRRRSTHMPWGDAPRQRPTTRNRRGVDWKLGNKILLTIFMAMAFLPVPGLSLVFAIAVYFIWFRTYEDHR